MRVTLERTNNAVRFEGKNPAGNTVTIEGSPDMGGEEKGVRPMELVLMALASCSSMDLVSILKKMRQQLDKYHVDVEAERDKDNVPAVFTKIHMTFYLYGTLKAKNVEQALRLSVETYCSVSKMLEKTATITYSYVINDQPNI